MESAGMALRYDLASHAIMGFSEVVKSFKTIRRIFLDTVAYLEQTRPDCLVVIDYPGFNIRLAQRAHALGIPVVYYISPQVWAWKKKRIHTIAETARKVLVILPFEEALYQAVGADSEYVGHPLLDQISAVPTTGEFEGDMVIGLLPGSREQEVGRLMSTMIDVARGIREQYPQARFITPCPDEARKRQVLDVAGDFPVETVIGKTYEVLRAARFCLVASGTATVETALFGVPMAVLYKTSAITYLMARYFIKIKHVCLVNILAGREVVPEFLQRQASAETVLPTALDLIAEGPRRSTMLSDLAEVKALLGGPGASACAAASILSLLSFPEKKVAKKSENLKETVGG